MYPYNTPPSKKRINHCSMKYLRKYYNYLSEQFANISNNNNFKIAFTTYKSSDKTRSYKAKNIINKLSINFNGYAVCVYV